MATPEPLGAGRAHRRRTPPACRACEESARAALRRPSGLWGQRVRRLVVVVVILLLPVELSADLAALTQIAGKLQSTVRHSAVADHEAVRFIDERILKSPWLKPYHAEAVGRAPDGV